MRPKWQAFINEYLIDFNATRAAKAVGYSQKTAYSHGQRLLKNVEISDAIKAAIAERSMGRVEVLTRLADMARGDMGDFLAIGKMGFNIDLDGAQEAGLTHLIKKVKQRTTISTSKDGLESEIHDQEIELYDAQSALVTLGKYHKLFSDQVEVSGDVVVKMLKGVSMDEI